MSEGMATQERPTLPQRLERIEELVKQALNHTDKMRPRPEEEEAKSPVSGGVEDSLARVEQRLEYLCSRLSDITCTVGQL